MLEKKENENGTLVLVNTSIKRNKDGTIRKTPKRTFLMDEVRSNSIAILSILKGLTQEQRKRVLNHALKVNEV